MKILYIGHENIFYTSSNLLVDFIPTGRIINNELEAVSSRNIKVTTLLGRLIMREYDMIILPGVNLTLASLSRYHTGYRRIINILIAKVIRVRFLSLIIRFFLGILLKNIKIAVLDRNFQNEPFNGLSQLLPDHMFYKVNLFKEFKEASPNIKPLPFWVTVCKKTNLDVIKDIDVSFIGSAEMSKYRQDVMPASKILEENGIRTYWRIANKMSERLSHNEYRTILARSRLVLSPQGVGWHCFRHYEALLEGAAPLINRPAEDLYTDLEEDVHAIFYEDIRDLIDKCVKYINGSYKFKLSPEELREWALKNHTPEAVAKYIIRET